MNAQEYIVVVNNEFLSSWNPNNVIYKAFNYMYFEMARYSIQHTDKKILSVKILSHTFFK
jgi:hypothetical protein